MPKYFSGARLARVLLSGSFGRGLAATSALRDMDDTLEQGAVAKVVGVQSNPQLNGTFVRLLRQLQNGRWETQGYCNPSSNR